MWHLSISTASAYFLRKASSCKKALSKTTILAFLVFSLKIPRQLRDIGHGVQSDAGREPGSLHPHLGRVRIGEDRGFQVHTAPPVSLLERDLR